MSYAQHAKFELGLLNESEELIETITKSMCIIDKQGGSGGVMMIINGMLNSLSKAGPDRLEEIPTDAILYEFCQYLKTCSKEVIEKTLLYIPKLMAFDPLTPLTGEDSEWYEISEGLMQNKRCGGVFKDMATGIARYVDKRIFNHPGYDYGYWSGWHSSSKSGGEITFPYTPSTEHIFYYSDDSQVIIDKEINPEAIRRLWWKVKVSGIHPEHNTIINDAVFLTLEQIDSAMKAFKDEVKGKVDLDDRYSFKSVVGEDEVVSEHIELKSERLLGLLGYDYQELEDDIFLIRGMKFKFRPVKVLIPNKFYQKWEHLKLNKEFIYTWTLSNDLKGDRLEEFCVDRLDHKLGTRHTYWATFPYLTDKDVFVPVDGDTDDYLYQQRRRLKFAHPSKRNRYAEAVAAVQGGEEVCKETVTEAPLIPEPIVEGTIPEEESDVSGWDIDGG